MNLETLVIKDVIPGKASEATLTPGRKFLQVIFMPLADEGYLNTKRVTSRNFWMDYLGGKREDGAELNIAADQLFLSICEACGITSDNIETIDWKPGQAIFQKVIGMKVKGSIHTDYVKGYSIPGSLSKIEIRYRYTTVVLDGEDPAGVFRNQGHVIIQDPEELQQIKQRLAEIASQNEVAREQRQRDRGVAPPTERTGTGAIATEKSLAGNGAPSVNDGVDPALSRNEDRRLPEEMKEEPIPHTDDLGYQS